MRPHKIFIALIILGTMCVGASMSNPAIKLEEGVALTVYNDDFGVVRQNRWMSFDRGINTVKFTDVASAIDPTSVNFRCLSSPGAVSILEQNYEYDLVSTASLLKRYIDRQINVSLKGSGADTGRELTGTLLTSTDRDLIIKSASGDIEIINENTVEEISLKELPDDLVTRPTLLWLAEAKEKAKHLCQVTYTTGRIGWKADYSAVLNDAEDKLDLSGWVTIDNKSGATYKEAIIKLIAGDVRRIVQPRAEYRLGLQLAEKMAAGAPAFEEKPFMEYHLYTLSRRSTINNNQVKQIEFITPAAGVPAKKLYIYERSKIADKVQIKIEFENTKENNLGIALPRGRVRVFKKDPADEALEFVGEDTIDHTPRKEKLSLYIGNAFDIAVEYTLLDSQHRRRWQQQKHKIELRNRKDQAVTVFVDEKFPAWVNWTIDESTHKYEKRDARTARFEVDIAADSTQVVQYTATQTW
ncbi:MAG: DUF4139 domain-containing protein [Sedimentisphaerales bacterium]|nr:DUF4139 domain-containing protein [Sedimentisphaerales bacterium]